MLAALIIILVLLALSRGRRHPAAGRGEAGPGPALFTSICPTCGSSLKRGERIRTVAWPGLKERMVYIYGCRYCYGGDDPTRSEAGGRLLKRVCPVCHRILRGSDFLLGRMWEEGRTRVHVIGCSRCRKV